MFNSSERGDPAAT
jgi:hypothetical protein